jgi:high affinity Mn2+ porin
MFPRGSSVTESFLRQVRTAVAFCALLFVCTLTAFAQQSGGPEATSPNQPSLITHQDVASALDAAIDQSPQTQPGDTQTAAGDSDSDSNSDGGIPTMFPHFKNDRIWLSGQANFISQWHPAFHSPYSGKNSLSAQAQDASSRVLTLYTGLRLTSTSELLCDIQETGGHGVGEALGVAGFLNLDVVRNPSLGKAPYVARLMWHQIILLGHKKIPNDQRGPYSLFSQIPERRIEIRFGKMSLADFFDLNTYGTDSNLQFMNWTVDNNGAFDYAADTRGFTFAALVEYHHNKHVTIRFAEALMPKVANGIHLDANLGRARAENIELELHHPTLHKQEGVLRLLTFVNHANMGDYRDAVDNFLAGLTPTPEITVHPLTTDIKYGFGANFEQPLTDWFGLFGRWGWNEGRHESYAYTEVDGTAEIGAWANGKRWGRKLDRLGLAYVSNGISRDHQEYLALGGLGFLLGDGRLNYGREDIVETFYTMHVWRGFYPALGFQYVDHPGYNRDRGPVVAPALRLHFEF